MAREIIRDLALRTEHSRRRATHRPGGTKTFRLRHQRQELAANSRRPALLEIPATSPGARIFARALYAAEAGPAIRETARRFCSRCTASNPAWCMERDSGFTTGLPDRKQSRAHRIVNSARAGGNGAGVSAPESDRRGAVLRLHNPIRPIRGGEHIWMPSRTVRWPPITCARMAGNAKRMGAGACGVPTRWTANNLKYKRASWWTHAAPGAPPNPCAWFAARTSSSRA